MRNLLLLFCLAIGIAASAQTFGDPIAELRGTSTADQIILSDGSGRLVWGDRNDLVSAGSGISISAAGVISNSAPDQPVSITATGRVTRTGDYPNFTINVPAEVDGSTTNEKISALSIVSSSLRVAEGGVNYDLALSQFISATSGNALTVTGGKLYAPTSGYVAPTKNFGRNTSAIAVGGNYTVTGASLPASSTAIDVYVDGRRMKPKESTGDTDWDFERTSSTVLKFNRAVVAQSLIEVVY